jgi:hypothetical protein
VRADHGNTTARASRIRLDSSGAALVTLVGAMLVVYGSTLLRSIHPWGDITKWQFLGKVLGIPHPTGYPVYLLATHLLSFLPFGSLALRVNAFSMVCAVLAVTGLFLILRELQMPPWFSALSALAFGCTATLWSQAVVAEVYALNAAFVSGTILFLLRWQRTRRDADLLVACGLYAFSFDNHLTVVCLLPAVAYLVLATQPSSLLRPRVLLPILGFVLVGIGLYGYLFLATSRGGPHLESRIETMGDLVEYVTGARYRRLMFESSFSDMVSKRVPDFIVRLLREYNLVALLAIPGFFCMPSRTIGVFFFLALAGYGAFIANYGIGDIQVYFIPVFLILAILIAAAVWRPFTGAGRLHRPLYVAKHALVAVAAVALLTANYRRNDLSSADGFDTWVRGILESVHSNALVTLDGWRTDYGLMEGILYCVYGDESYAGRNIYVATELDPFVIRAYLEGRGEITSHVMGRKVPAGLSVYTAAAPLLRSAGGAGLGMLPAVHPLVRLIVPPDRRGERPRSDESSAAADGTERIDGPAQKAPDR